MLEKWLQGNEYRGCVAKLMRDGDYLGLLDAQTEEGTYLDSFEFGISSFKNNKIESLVVGSPVVFTVTPWGFAVNLRSNTGKPRSQSSPHQTYKEKLRSHTKKIR